MSLNLDRTEIINQMFSYLDEERENIIHKRAFQDISEVFLQYYEEYYRQYMQYVEDKKQDKKTKANRVKWVCNASMGHGKSTVLECFLKWLVSERKATARVPVLLVIREKIEAEKLEKRLNAYKEDTCIRIDSDNREVMEKYAQCYQIIIITHARLDNIALKLGNPYIYKVWHQYAIWNWGIRDIVDDKNLISKRHRMLIVDEKPTFMNYSIFDVGKENNCLSWFDNLAKKQGADVLEVQSIRTYILLLLIEQLEKNATDTTTALLDKEERKTERFLKLMSVIKTVKNNKHLANDLEHYKKMLLFEKLLIKDGTGRIDKYVHHHKLGVQIIVSQRIHYNLGINMLVLDGTCEATNQQYKGFTLKRVKNYNDYSRLHLHQEVINTSKDSREKDNKSTQKTISDRIQKLREQHGNQLFVIPLKNDIQHYLNDAILDEHRKYFDESEETKAINLLNTTGKNYLKHFSALYLTALPRMNPEHYKAMAISIYGNEVSLDMNTEKGNLCWFIDMKLEVIYRGMLYAEILQIIHRCALRILEPGKLTQEIDIYIAYDDSRKDHLLMAIQPLMLELNNNYLNNKAKYDSLQLINMSMFRREETIREWAKQINKWIERNTSIYNPLGTKLLSKIGGKLEDNERLGEKFRKWINDHWISKKDEINKIFAEYNLIIYEGEYRGKPAKHITTINYYNELTIFG